MVGILFLATLFAVPGLTLFATAAGNGASRWPWPQGLAVSLAVGVAVAALLATALGAFGIFSLGSECAVVVVSAFAILAAGRFRLAPPFGPASRVAAGGFVVVALVAGGVLLGRPFEMLVGGRDATVYTVAGIGLARQGSFVLHDEAADRIGAEGMHRLYGEAEPGWLRAAACVKYPGFYYVDIARGSIVAQGLPLLPALIAIFYATFGLAGALATTNAIGVLAVLSVFAGGSFLVGELAATLGAVLLALDLVEVWAARYPVAEILFQMLLFAGLAAFLRRGRFGQAVAGLLLGATFFAKIEAVLLLVPVLAFVAAGFDRRSHLLTSAFWAPFAATTLAAAAYWLAFQSGYLGMAFLFFSRWETRVARELVGRPLFWVGVALAAAVAALALVGRSWLRRLDRVRAAGRVLAVLVVLGAAYGYWIRPWSEGFLVGQGKTLLWLSWYVGPGVLLLAVAGLAHFLWMKLERESLFALAILLTLAVVFLHFTFVNLLHIYMTRRFVPATLPLVCLFAGYAAAAVGGIEVRRPAAAILAALVFLASAATIVERSRHLYAHREYPGVAGQFAALAETLRGADLVVLGDVGARDLLGPTLEFVFGLKTAFVRPRFFDTQRDLIHGWLEHGWRLAGVTSGTSLDGVRGAEVFDPVDRTALKLRTLAELEDRFPDEFWDGPVRVSLYTAGPGIPAWKLDSDQLLAAACSAGVRLLDGTPALVRFVRNRCHDSGAPPRTVAVLADASDAPLWEATLQAYGARFTRRSFVGGVALFDGILPQPAEEARPIAPDGWTVEASDGKGGEHLAIDGSLDTRWASQSPQRSGMTFTITFPAAVDVSWAKIRMGRFGMDRARRLAVETSSDGSHWKRREIPSVVDSIHWEGEVPAEDSSGNVDLWVNEARVRHLRLVDLGEHPRFDWSIAELEIDGKPSR